MYCAAQRSLTRLPRVASIPRAPLRAGTPTCFTSGHSPILRHRGLSTSAVVGDVAATTEATPTPAAPDAKPPVQKRVLSGVQPTGKLHLGNYLGAIRNWVDLQASYDTFFCVVDLHAITVPHDPVDLRSATRTVAATYMAAGIDPERSSVFVQSHVTAHAELTWLLTCVTPVGWLNRMVQYKEKGLKQGGNVAAGLMTYPVLMAADILLYQADLVPVGEDQKQHLELARDLAERVNGLFGGKQWKKRGGRGGRIFKVPDVMIPPAGARVMSLQDGTSKMSKSAENDLSRINLTDEPTLIANKIKRCKTDLLEGLEFDNPDRPEATNLLTIYQLVTGMSKEAVLAEVGGMRWSEFKPRLTDAVVAHLQPIQSRYNELLADEAFIDQVLARGAQRADEVATRTLDQCKDAMGFTLRHGKRAV